jgi:predicted ATPase with chaperone activity
VASVCGIDAYLFELDVGSPDKNRFRVAGLPDNAVKESGKRIKAAWKNRTDLGLRW